jgi:formate/nitrite transporter FocA (FNT family)
MLQEAFRPIALLLCLLSLCAVFFTAFLVPATTWQQRSLDSVVLLSLAAGICLSSGMIFRESTPRGIEPVMHTLPVRLFCWATAVMVVLFVTSWYLETYCIFYRDVRRW